MKPSRIDFAPRSLRRTIARTRPATWLIGSIGLMLCASSAVIAYNLLRQGEARQAELQRIQTRIAARIQPAPARHEVVIPDGQADAVNEIVGRLNLPWRDVFQAIESATPASVALLELSPDAKRHAIKGTAEAKNGDDMLNYIARIGSQPFFDSVVLTRHEINEQDPNRPLRFQFLAVWEDTGK
ncbi:MAG: hypothetical protein JWQ10_2705 [Herbaspirillum sp.]|jgi:Tfp pilus assembly protein PilN|nr:hypothetical protein [Herbaspirillum sp.]